MFEELKYDRRGFLGTAIAAAGLGMFTMSGKTMAGDSMKVRGELSSLRKANAWINSQPLTADNLAGKVVLINFCTYTCINWLRTLPYIRAWEEKYKTKGLVIIGVHTPEFGFEENIDNVQKAIKDMKIGYPIAIDNDRKIWSAFSNQYWPAFYFIDTKGRIRHHQFGEGEYEQSEKIIQQLLQETGAGGVGNEFTPVKADGIEVAADWNNLKSPENYLGYNRTENFSSPDGVIPDRAVMYTTPGQLTLNQWALSGDWKMGKEATVLNKSNGKIVYRFHARDLHLVMGPAVRGNSIKFRVLIDGQAPGLAHGVDIDDQGYGTVSEQRLYQLIRQSKPVVDRQFVIEFPDPGIEAFAFTFG